MDLCAELTLHVMRFVQEPRDPPSSPRQWLLLPEGRRAAWPIARAFLADAPKPLMVAPLFESGMLGWWDLSALAGDHRRLVDRDFANQQEWLATHATHRGWSPKATILFETEADQVELPMTELGRWAREYAIPVGWTLGDGPDKDRPGRLLIRRSQGEWSPGAACQVHA